MGYYGNSGQGNRGKKYILAGGASLRSPETEERGRRFGAWFAGAEAELRAYLAKCGDFDADAYSAAYLSVHEAIVEKGRLISNLRAYFLRTYFTARLQRTVDAVRRASRDLPIREDRGWYETAEPGADLSPSKLEEVLEYVRRRYQGEGATYFEVYVGLWPDVSYDRVAEVAGVPRHKVWPVMGRIFRDLAARGRACDLTDARDDIYLSGGRKGRKNDKKS